MILGGIAFLDKGGEVVHLLSLVYQSLIVSGNLVRPLSTVNSIHPDSIIDGRYLPLLSASAPLPATTTPPNPAKA